MFGFQRKFGNDMGMGMAVAEGRHLSSTVHGQ